MKKMFFLLGVPLLFSLGACSNDPSIDNHPKEQLTLPDEQANRENATLPEDMRKENSGNLSDDGKVHNDQNANIQMDDLNFTKFDLEINYGPNKKFDYEYEYYGSGTYEAELVDEVHDKILKGMEAFVALHNHMKELQFDKNTTKDIAIQRILEIFRLDQNYSKFDLHYILKDGTELEFEDRR